MSPIRILSLAGLLSAGLAAYPAVAQTPSPFSEQQQAIKSPNAVTTLGANLFGDEINLYQGTVTFRQTDVALRGNNGLSVQVGRRLLAGNFGYTSPKFAFGAWQLDLPYIYGNFADATRVTGGGWTGDGGGSARCSNFGAPGDALYQGYGWVGPEYWQGTYLYVPGAGEQALLARSASYTFAPQNDPAAHPVVTANKWAFSCLPSVENGTGTTKNNGEGFLAKSPDGTTYRFDHLVQYQIQALSKPVPPNTGGAIAAPVPYPADSASGSTTQVQGTDPPSQDASMSPVLPRMEMRLLPTLITDRFGNQVRYTYDPAHPENVTAITSNDGRSITLTYDPAFPHLVKTVSDGTRTWTYIYDGNAVAPQLVSVQLPDKSAWTYVDAQRGNIAGIARISPQTGVGGCGSDPGYGSTVLTYSMTHPSGATGTFTWQATRHGRSYVEYKCNNIGGNYYLINNRYFGAYSLKEKVITGAALPDTRWTYSYGPENASWDKDCPAGAACLPQSKTVQVTDPENTVTLYEFGNRWRVNEGMLLSKEDGWDGAGSLRRTEYSYVDRNLRDSNHPFPVRYGVVGETYGDADVAAQPAPMDTRRIHQQGETFLWHANSFDVHARPLSQGIASTLGKLRTDWSSYVDNVNLWVLDLPGATTEESTRKDIVLNTYDPATATLTSVSHYGKVDESYTYYADGTRRTSKDGNGNTITFSNYKRGIAQNVRYTNAAGTESATESVTVNNLGGTDTYTNAAGSVTGFGYDAMGRLASITYPSDTVSWYPVSVRLNFIASDEFGVPANHWRQIVDIGPNGGPYARTVTVYDALMRPVVERRSDTARDGNTSQAVLRNFDSAGRKTYESYVKRDVVFSHATPSSPAGTAWTYDALGRTTREEYATELADKPVAARLTSYDSGFVTRATDARGVTTETYYQAFDDPDAAFLSTVYPPMGVKLEWTRDIFGKTRTLTRSGKDAAGNPISATRTYVYDANERLCKRIEPETGATVIAYDGANNIAWSASGLALPNTGSCDTASAPAASKINFSYNLYNQVLNTTYGDNSPSVARTYTPDGLPKTVNSGGANWTYDYNARRLLATETLSYGGTNYRIDHGFNPYGVEESLTYPFERLKVFYGPTALGQPSMLCTSSDPAQCGQDKPGTFAYAVQTHPNNALQFFNYGNGILHTTQQNLRGLPNRAIDAGVLNDGYSYDVAGNVVNIGDAQEGIATRGIDYDALERVSEVRAPNMWGTITYRYDGLDNLVRTTVTGAAGKVPARDDQLLYNYATNRLTGLTSSVSANSTTYGYDVRGNITSRTKTQSGTVQQFAFDLGNRLKSAPGVATYLYDGHGRLASATAADGSNTVYVHGLDGTLLYKRDTRYPGISFVRLNGGVVAEVTGAGAAVKYDHTDALGSTVATTTNASTTPTPRTRHEPYGAIAIGPEQVIGFTGHPTVPAPGLINMQQRYYDPQIARFLSVDPVLTDPNTGGSFNRYAYANNRPYKYVDPDGRNIVDVAFLAVDLYRLGSAVAAGEGIGAALVDVGISSLAVASPVPFLGEALKGARAVERVAEGAKAAEEGTKFVKVAKTSSGRRVEDYTKAQKNAMKRENAEKNGGQMACENCGKGLENVKSEKGVPTPDNQAQVHHTTAIENGGTRETPGQVLCPPCHRNEHQ